MDSPLPPPPPRTAAGNNDAHGPTTSPPPGEVEANSAWRRIVRDVLANQPPQTPQAQQRRVGGVETQPQQSQSQSGLPLHARQRSASVTAGAAAAPPSGEWRVVFHHDAEESDSEHPHAPDTAAAAGADPALPQRIKAMALAEADDAERLRPSHLADTTTPMAEAISLMSSSAAGKAVSTPRSLSPPAAPMARRPSLGAQPSTILRQHSSHSLQALNFLPEGLSEEEVRRRYPSLTPADLDDIGGFLEMDASGHQPSEWSYASLFDWSAEKLDLLLTAIQPEHLTLIAHRSMTEHITQRPVDVAFRNLHCIRDQQTKLRGLSGYCKPGMMVAVWGAADSGVSSFLALLAGCYRDTGAEVTGELLLNGAPLRWRRKRRQIGYVTKEAENFAQLTVEQTLYFSARLRLPRLPENILRFRVGLVCKLLGLSHLRDSMVGSASIRGLSGGERKRVAYACELIVGYSLILCDQPTDGLDQPSALSLMQNFKLTCGAGRSMMTSLASASVDLFELFDFLLLLSKGACIYFGPRMSVMEYLRAQGFEPPRASDPALAMVVPDFLQALSATPERFWKATLPISVRQRPCPWLSEQFAFFQDSTTVRSGTKQSKEAAAAADAEKRAARSRKFLLEVDVRKLARLDSSDVAEHSFAGAAAHATGGGGGGGGSDIEMGEMRSHRPSPRARASSGASSNHAATQHARVQSSSRRRAWKRLLKGWRASDLNADCAYVLDFDLQPIQTHLSQDIPAPPGAAATAAQASDGTTRNNLSAPPSPAPSSKADAHSPEPRSAASKRPFLPHRTSFATQVWLCLVRQSVFTYRNPGLWLYNWLKTLVLGLIVGSLFYQLQTNALRDVRPRFGMLYFLITFYGNSAIQMISVLLSSRSVVQWETFAGYYHPLAYSLALTIVFIPVAIIEMFLLVIVLYPLSGLAGGIASANFVYMWLQLTLSSLTGRAWILLFTTFLPTQALANIVAPVFNLLVSSFCGYLNPRSNIPSGWIWMYYLSYYTYVFRGLSLNEFQSLTFECPSAGSCAVVTGADALSLYDINYSDPERQKWIDCAILFGFYLAFQILAALALLTRHYAPREDSARPDFGDDGVVDATTDKGASVSAAAAAASAAHGESAPLLSTPAEKHVLSFLNLSYTVPVPAKHPKRGKLASLCRPEMEERRLLNGISGVAATGQLIALMGTSGAGKSTLLDCLAQKKTIGTITGSILWDGQPLPPNFSQLCALVEQFDSLSPQSTIRETLFFSGRLRLPSHLSDAEIDARVLRMLDTLELTPMMDARIGAVETGNLLAPELRKKVAIAVELMAEPSVLFLDEPTTGLDSMSSLLIARLLRQLSRRLLIVCTIHQPSNAVLAQFDVLLLVKPPGTLAFYGPFDQAARFFQQLPARFPAQLGDVHFAAPAPADNLADMVLGALKVVSKLEGEAPASKDGAAAPFSCRDAFLHSAYSQPLLRALADVHGEKAIVEADLPAPSSAPAPGPVPAPRNDGPAKEHKEPESDVAGADFVIPLPPHSMLRGGEKSASDGSPPSSSTAAAASWSSSVRSQWFAFRELLRRFAVSTVRARRSFTLRFFTCTVYGFVTGTLFYQLQFDQKDAASRISFIYFAARFSLFSGNLKLPGVFSTRVMMFRETNTRMYSALAYAAARSIADLPWIAIEMMVFGVIVYFCSGLQSDAQLFGLFYLVLLLDRLISIGFIELVGALTPTIELAQSLQTAINMLFMLFSGFFIAVQAIPRGWRWMTYLSPYYYVIRFLANNEYTRIDEFRCADEQRVAIPAAYDTCPVTAAMRDSGSKCPLQCGAEVLQQYTIPQQPGFLYEDLGILILFAAAYPIMAALALRFVNFIRR